MDLAPPVRRLSTRWPLWARWSLAGAAAALVTALLGGTLAGGLLSEGEGVRQTRTAYEVTGAR